MTEVSRALDTSEAEAAVVARLLLDPKQMPLVSFLTAEEFSVQAWGEAFQGIIDLDRDKKPIDLIHLRSVGVDLDVLDLPPMANAPLEEYAKLIQTGAVRRRVIHAAQGIIERARDADVDPIVAIHDAFNAIVQDTEDDELVSATRASVDYVGTLNARRLGGSTGMTFGIPGMDDHVLPAAAGEMIVIAARPGVGKTVMAENIIDHILTQGKGTVVFASLEMTRDQLHDRAVSRATGIPVGRLTTGALEMNEWERVFAVAEDLGKRDIFYADDPYMTTGKLRAACSKAQLMAGGRLSAIVVDYLQLLKDKQGGDSEVTRVTGISHALKALARGFNVPLFAVVQLSRAGADVDPKLQHLRDSGAIEQDADVVVGLRRDLESARMRVAVLKQRQGRLSHFWVRYDGNSCTFHAPPQDFDPMIQAGMTPPADPAPPEEDEEDLEY